jgi:hypothetical protein
MARHLPASSHACGELQEVCEGPDLGFTREETTKIVDQEKQLKKTQLKLDPWVARSFHNGDVGFKWESELQ